MAAEAAEVAEQPGHSAKKTSLTFQNTKINKSASVLLAVEKVVLSFLDFYLVILFDWVFERVLIVAVGILKGYDQLMNLVLDNVEEHLRGT